MQGQSVEFASSTEGWTQYKLEDGAVFRIKTMVLEVVRLDEYNEEGDPVYQFRAQQIVGVQVPEDLKKKS